MKITKATIGFNESVTIIGIILILATGTFALTSNNTGIPIKAAITTCFLGGGVLIGLLWAGQSSSTYHYIRNVDGAILYFKPVDIGSSRPLELTKEDAQKYIDSGKIDEDLKQTKVFFVQ